MGVASADRLPAMKTRRLCRQYFLFPKYGVPAVESTCVIYRYTRARLTSSRRQHFYCFTTLVHMVYVFCTYLGISVARVSHRAAVWRRRAARCLFLSVLVYFFVNPHSRPEIT